MAGCTRLYILCVSFVFLCVFFVCFFSFFFTLHVFECCTYLYTFYLIPVTMLLCSIFVCLYKMLFIIGGHKDYSLMLNLTLLKQWKHVRMQRTASYLTHHCTPGTIYVVCAAHICFQKMQYNDTFCKVGCTITWLL